MFTSLFKSRKSFDATDAALAELKQTVAIDVLCDLDPDGVVFLYAEANIAAIDLVLMLRTREGTLSRLRPPMLLKIHLRELWSQFRIAKLPIWAGIGMVLQSPAISQVAYVYPDEMDLRHGFDDRARRWMVSTAGLDALAALRVYEAELV